MMLSDVPGTRRQTAVARAARDRVRKLAVPAALALTVVAAAGEIALGWRFATSTALPAYLVFGALGSVVSFFDLGEQRVPNGVVLPTYPLLVSLFAAASAADGRWHHMLQAVLAMLVLVTLFAALALARPGGIGLGDVKLAGLVGLACGYMGSAAVVAGVLLAFGLAAVTLLGLRLIGRRHETRIAFAPFMVAGSVLAVLVVR